MRVLVLGIGNVMFADEGFGVHMALLLEQNYSFSKANSSVDFMDGGTLAHHLLHIIANYEQLILIDCISADGAKPGQLYSFDYENIPSHINFQGSAHEIEMLQALSMMQMHGDLPKTRIFGVVPLRIAGMSFKISSKLQDAAIILEKEFLAFMKDLGFSYSKKDDKNIASIAASWELA